MTQGLEPKIARFERIAFAAEVVMRHDINPLHAAISMRNWADTERHANVIRDRLQDAIFKPSDNIVVSDLLRALEHIDGEAPAREPSDVPTVGFPQSRDPEMDDGNEVVREAFDEGVTRGIWIAAQIARAAIAKAGGAS